MGMSSSVYFIKPPDEEWKKMKAIYNACEDAGVDVPNEVIDFFEGEIPDEKGVIFHAGSEYGENHLCCSRYNEDMQDGFEIDIDLLPKGIKIIRFVNSY